MITNRDRSLAQTYAVTVDGAAEPATTGSRSTCDTYARELRRIMRDRGEKTRGRVVVAPADEGEHDE